MLRLKLDGKSVQGLSKLANWNRDTCKLKNSISQLLKGVQSSITTLKCSEDSHYGVRIRVSKSSDFPFPSYGPRPFFGSAILAENWKIYIIANLFKWGVASYVYWYQKIDCNCLFKEITKGNDIWKKKLAWSGGFSGLAIPKNRDRVVY